MTPKVFTVPDQAIVAPITIVPELCTGCNLCLHVCPVDLFLPNEVKGGEPLVHYPGECWYEGSCVDVCPEPGAIRLNRPPAMRVNWKLKADLRRLSPQSNGPQSAPAPTASLTERSSSTSEP